MIVFLLLPTIFAILIVGMHIAYGSSLDCEGIRNADQRNYCRAVTKKQKTWCEFIKDHDLRYRCRAEASR